jgi:serine/threonine protein kinase
VTTADDDEKTVTGPTVPGRRSRDDAVTGIDAERERGRAAADRLQGGHTLPLGTRLRDYEITGLVGEGGFGIVYLAWDHSLQRRVAIKEYMPASMATRVSGSSAIIVKSERHLDTFRAGLKSFVNEARLLARFDHPSLVKVYRFWEENGTAYMAMPYYEGPTLKAALAALDGGAPAEDELRAWLQPLLDALELMHSKHCFHRDIAPDNILLTAGGPLLLDFGAARRVIGDMTHALTVVLKPGYAPIEQYGDVASMAQGAWTDLYALASVVYFAITGSTPTSSVERLLDDRVEPLAAAARGRYSEELLRAVDAALAVRPADRPQSVAAFRALLGLPATPAPVVSDSGWASGASGWGSVPAPLAGPERTAPLARTADVATAPTQALARADAAATPAAKASKRGRRRVVAIAVASGAVVAVLAVFGWLQPKIIARPAAAPQAPAASASAATPPAPQIAETPVAASAATPAPIVDEGVATTPVPPPPRSIDTTPTSPQRASVDATPTSPPVEPARSPPPATVVPGTESEARAASASVPRSQRPRREAVAPRSDTAPPPPRSANSRCSDILQKASLEPLTASEADYLRRECR